MHFKVITLLFFFMLAAQPQSSDTTTLILGVFLFLKLQKLTILTLRVRRNGVRRNYVLSPGQAYVDFAANTFRTAGFAIEFLFIFFYSRFIAYMCQTTAARNAVSAYTVIFCFILTWEHFLYGMYGKPAIRNQ